MIYVLKFQKSVEAMVIIVQLYINNIPKILLPIGFLGKSSQGKEEEKNDWTGIFHEYLFGAKNNEMKGVNGMLAFDYWLLIINYWLLIIPWFERVDGYSAANN